jgi:hypothetical protein
MSGGAAARMKGIRWERAVAQYLGTATTRSTRPGVHDDAGDVVMENGLLLECKDHGSWRVQDWFSQIEKKAGPDERPALILKRRQMSTAYGLIVVRLGDVDLHHL